MAANPFALFPKEIWDMILNFLMKENPTENSKDVLNLMHAYPVFEREFASLKEDCLILQVLSLLIKKGCLGWYVERAVVNCRLINKRWCRVVDAYLNSLKSSTCYVNDFFVDNWHLDNHEQRTDFDWQREVTKTVFDFMKDFKEHPASRNPFLIDKRRIIVRAMPCLFALEEDEDEWEYARDRDTDCRAQEKFMEELIKMLEKYGQHIWNLVLFYDCSFFGIYNQPLLWANIGKILELVPNLKYFHLYNYSGDDFEFLRKAPESAFECLKVSLPDLPRLEELTLSFCPYRTYQSEVNLWSNLVRRYASNVKLLQLDAFGPARHDDDVFKFVEIPSASAVTFSRLKKLTYRDGSCNKKSLNYFLDQLLSWNAPNLGNIGAMSKYKFRYGEDTTETHPAINSGNEWKKLIQKLKRFPTLKRFATNYCFVREEDLSVEEDSHLSLEYLRLSDNLNDTYKMLLCFPNLIDLKIQSDTFPTVQDFSVNTAVKIREEIQTGQMFKSNIWQLCSNLKTFTLLSAQVHSYNRTIIYLEKPFTRDNCEKFNKKAAIMNVEGENRLDFDPLRPDITQYLDHEAKGDCRGCGYCIGNPQSSYFHPNHDDEYQSDDDDG